MAAGTIPAELTLKGPRHVVATALREAGVSPGKIADPLGQKIASTARHYSPNAILAKSNRATRATLDSETKHKSKVVKPFAVTVTAE
ncbi:MAG: hypothetical protein JXR75_03255 [Rhodobacteraceae bacterium]|nr:hypothetical protein [Paracoccaceae bacterium]